MTRSCVLGADARLPTEYDGKGNGLTRLAGHTPMVGRHEAICNMPGQRPAGGSQITRSAAIAPVVSILVRFMFCFVLLYQADRRDVVCHTHTQLVYTHTQLFHNFLTHHLFLAHHTHTTLPIHFFNLSILHHLLCLSFLLRPASTLASHHWKKLTWGFIRSFNLGS